MRLVLTVPELPGVETSRRGLAARIISMRSTAVEIGDHSSTTRNAPPPSPGCAKWPLATR